MMEAGENRDPEASPTASPGTLIKEVDVAIIGKMPRSGGSYS